MLLQDASSYLYDWTSDNSESHTRDKLSVRAVYYRLAYNPVRPSGFSASCSNLAAPTTNWQNDTNGLIRSGFLEDNIRPIRGGGGREKSSVVETDIWETTDVE